MIILAIVDSSTIFFHRSISKIFDQPTHRYFKRYNQRKQSQKRPCFWAITPLTYPQTILIGRTLTPWFLIHKNKVKPWHHLRRNNMTQHNRMRSQKSINNILSFKYCEVSSAGVTGGVWRECVLSDHDLQQLTRKWRHLFWKIWIWLVEGCNGRVWLAHSVHVIKTLGD